MQKVKSKLKSAAIWFVENKDKSLDQILVERWKEKCSGATSKCRNKRGGQSGGSSCKSSKESCVSAALTETEEDTSEEKLVKDALKSLLGENSDKVFEFLSRYSSRTFRDIENEDKIQDKLFEMPEKYERLWETERSKTFSELESDFEREKAEKISQLSKDVKTIFSKVGGQISPKFRRVGSSCSKQSRATKSRQCQITAGRNLGKKQKCREAQATRRKSCIEEMFDETPEDSLQDKQIKAELEELATQDLETGTQLLDSCQIPENKRSKRSTSPACPLPKRDIVISSSTNAQKHFVDDSNIQVIFDGSATEAQIDALGAERFEELTKLFPDRTKKDEGKNFAKTNTVLGKSQKKKLDLKKFTATGNVGLGQTKPPPDGRVYDYREYKSDKKFKFVQLQWVEHTNPDGSKIKTTVNGKNRVEGHFVATPMKDYIIIGVDTFRASGNVEVSHLESESRNPAVATDSTGTPLSPLEGRDPYKYNLNPDGGKGKGRGSSGK